jgi:hypothetical protein
MYEGKIVKNVMAKDIDVEELGLYMAGVKRDIVYPDQLSEPNLTNEVKEEGNERKQA